LPAKIKTYQLFPMSFSDGRFALLLYFVSLPVVWWLINVAVTQPYMDEIFHVPQTQRFCALDFTHWDDKITTLPGLYLFSTLFSFAAGCSVASLRFFNLLWSIGCAWVLNELLSQWQPHLTPEQRRWKLLELCMSFCGFTLLFTDVSVSYLVLDLYSVVASVLVLSFPVLH
jgi:alpha-1,2-glucosyltransferase